MNITLRASLKQLSHETRRVEPAKCSGWIKLGGHCLYGAAPTGLM
jgi:hypothetical protein